MTQSIKVFKPGTPCLVGPNGDKVAGIIISVSLSSVTDIQYKVAWWDGKTRTECWLDDYEVQAHNKTDEIFIGFRD